MSDVTTNPEKTTNPNRLQCAYEFDEVNLTEESITITFHRSVLSTLSARLCTTPDNDRNNVARSLRSLGHNLETASLILHGNSKGDKTIFKDIIRTEV